MTTKEKIMYESLELFSVHGFEGVSMRDIVAAVNIRESSIYKHYSGKKAIMDAIVARAVEKIESITVKLDAPDSEKNSSVARYMDMKVEEIADFCSLVRFCCGDLILLQKGRRFLIF